MITTQKRDKSVASQTQVGFAAGTGGLGLALPFPTHVYSVNKPRF